MKMGYDVLTAVRFSEEDGSPQYRTAEIIIDGETRFILSYGSTAGIWRINLGWRRRKNKNQLGFVIDLERGFWAKDQEGQDEDADNPISPHTGRVIPYVDDRKNVLLIEPAAEISEAEMASLQTAVKLGIQIRYQLEDNELASEALPDKGQRRIMMFYESAEGGAGVLRRLIDDPFSLAEVAREALRICHFDPDSGEDLRRAERAAEDCESACYDCLMSYNNQPEHKMLDRHLVKDHLMNLIRAEVKSSPAPVPRAQHLENLKKQCDSQLERQWLDHLEARKLTLPCSAQVLVKECSTKPDFMYHGSASVAIYIDGPKHDFPDRHKRDVAQTEAMEDRGYMVIRFSNSDDWDAIIDKYPSVFGVKK
jgi:very-short-patch-repair endonuclease